MKTIVEIPDALLNEVRALAEKENTTLESLIEEGLRHVVAEGRQRHQIRPPRVVTFGGKGLQPGVATLNDMLDQVYAGRGM